MTPSPFEALRSAIERAGSQTAFARICGVGQPAVWKWLQSSKRLPAEHVLAVEAETGVSRHHLRPDIYPIDLPPAGGFYGVDHSAIGRDFTARSILKDGRVIDARRA